MKGVINYYYNFNITKYEIINDNYWFNYNNNYFCFYDIKQNNINYSIDLLKNININKISKIIFNKDNNIITTYGDKKYILLKIMSENRFINVNDITQFNNYILSESLIKFYKNDWSELWKRKIDYLEYYIIQNYKSNNSIKCLLYYFIGLGENAISFYEKTLLLYSKTKNNIVLSLSHNRIKYSDLLYELYNPLNIIVDFRVRDLAEYLKSFFLTKEYTINELEKIIYSFNYNKFDYMLLLSRLMFPTFFFDKFSNLQIKKNSETDILEFYNLTEKYEAFMKDIYNILSKKFNIPFISWIV